MESNDVIVPQPGWPELARRRWRKAAISEEKGGGPFAVVQRCEKCSILLYATADDALYSVEDLCTNRAYCYMDHSVVQLGWNTKHKRPTAKTLHRTKQIDKKLLLRYRRYGS